MSSPVRPDSPGMNIGKFALLVAVLSVAAILVYNTFFEGGGANYTSVPKDMQVNYMPADFKPSINEEEALTILSNPQRYRKEFDQLIYNFNLSLMLHVANRMGMPENLKGRVASEYKKHHPYLVQMYYNDFISLKDTSSNLYQQWYENESTSSVDLLNEVASKYTCFFVNHIVTTLLQTQDGKLNVKGNKVETPCGVALTEALRPMIARLQDRAAIRDFSKAKGLMQQKVERAITELATYEVRDKKGLDKQLQTKVWGYTVSQTDLEVTAISILKIGFKLDQYFQVNTDTKNKTVVVTLPEPTILSHEVYPKVEKMDIGWLREVSSVDINKNFNALREDFRRDALESDVMSKAKDKAKEVMEMILLPMIKSTNKSYKLQVRFQRSEATGLDQIKPQNDGIDSPAKTTAPSKTSTPKPKNTKQ